jgi:hypothetical protein
VDPLGSSTVESDRGDAGRQWRVRHPAACTKVAAGLRRRFLAQLTRAGRNPFELAVAGRTKDNGRIRAGSAGSAYRRKHQLERTPREFCEFAEGLGAVSLQPQGVVLHGTEWDVVQPLRRRQSVALELRSRERSSSDRSSPRVASDA